MEKTNKHYFILVTKRDLCCKIPINTYNDLCTSDLLPRVDFFTFPPEFYIINYTEEFVEAFLVFWMVFWPFQSGIFKKPYHQCIMHSTSKVETIQNNILINLKDRSGWPNQAELQAT